MLSLQGPNAEKLVTEVTITNGLPCHDLAHMQVTIADSKGDSHCRDSRC
jgi:glycine cleavage system aminomethyltransferase T